MCSGVPVKSCKPLCLHLSISFLPCCLFLQRGYHRTPVNVLGNQNTEESPSSLNWVSCFRDKNSRKKSLWCITNVPRLVVESTVKGLRNLCGAQTMLSAWLYFTLGFSLTGTSSSWACCIWESGCRNDVCLPHSSRYQCGETATGCCTYKQSSVGGDVTLQTAGEDLSLLTGLPVTGP